MESEEFVLEAHEENLTSYFNISAWSMKKISHRSLSRIEKESGVKTGNAVQTTYALEKACGDKWNAVSIAVGHRIVTTSSLTMFNVDGTSFQTGGRLMEPARVK